MSDDFEFDTVSGGDWVKGSEHIGEWVLIRVHSVTKRQSNFTGEDESVLEADWAFDLLGAGPHVIEKGLLNSDAYIAGKCNGKRLVVGRIARGIPKQKGYQGAIFLEQPDVPEMTRATEAARAILTAERESKAKAKLTAAPKAPPVDTGEQELHDLLADL